MKFVPDNPRKKYELRKDWLDYRMTLFNNYCLPSVQSQTFKDFDWWILVDPTFSGLSKTHTKNLEQYGRILRIEALWDENQPEVGTLLSKEYKDIWTCSVKLDSDDIIRRNFFEILNNHVTEKESWVSFWEGYMLKGSRVAVRHCKNNPFVAYVEYANPIQTVMRTAHNNIMRDSFRRNIPINLIKDVKGWIQVDHGDNIKNTATTKIPEFNAIAQDCNFLKQDFIWNN